MHERFKEIIAEGMAADGIEYGYTAIERKADSGEHRAHSDVEVYRQMAAQQEELEKVTQKQEDTQKKIDMHGKRLAHTILDFMEELTGERPKFKTYTQALFAVRSAMTDFKETTEERAKQKAQDEAEAAFQEKEDALEAQKAVLTELEEVKAKLQKTADTDTSRKRFMEARRFKDGTTLEDAYQTSMKKRQESTERLLEQAIDIAARYEAMQREDNGLELG